MGSIYLLCKFLSASEYGHYTFLFSLIIFFTNAGHLGIGYSNVYYLANKEISQDVILGNSLFFCFLSGIITCLIMNLLPYIFINMFHDIDSFIVLVASLGIATCICERFLLGYFNGKEDYSKYLFVFSLSWALQAIIIGLFYLFLQENRKCA